MSPFSFVSNNTPISCTKFMTYCITKLSLRILHWDWCLVIGVMPAPLSLDFNGC